MTYAWTADRVPDSTGKVIIVTGVNSGIGFEAAVEFARKGATDPEVVGGRYYGPDGFMEQAGYPVVVDSNRASHEEEAARQLRGVSERLTGVGYGRSLG